MELLIGIGLGLFIGLIILWIYSKTRPPKIQEKVIERVIHADITSQEKAKMEEYHRLKQKEIDDSLAEEQRIKYAEIQEFQRQQLAEIKAEISLKKVELLNNLSNEIKIFESQQNNKKNSLAENFEIFKEKMKFEAEKLHTIIASKQEEVNFWKNKHDAAIQSYKDLDELKNAENHYRIILSSDEQYEIEELNEVIARLKNPMPFYKAMYDIYYKNKINDLVNRVVGPNRVSGIYKITHVDSGKVYIGQSVDIGERWKQHAKRGCGADTLTNNKLYPAMMEFGIDRFSFEIIETTIDTNKLNEMEKYWQEFFKAKDFGFSIK